MVLGGGDKEGAKVYRRPTRGVGPADRSAVKKYNSWIVTPYQKLRMTKRVRGRQCFFIIN